MVQGSGLGIKEEIAAPMRASRTDDLAAALIRAGPPGTMVVPVCSDPPAAGYPHSVGDMPLRQAQSLP